MTPKTFVILAAGAAVSLALATATYVASVPWSADSQHRQAALLPSLMERGSELQAIEVTREGQTLKLALKDGQWLLASHDGYPAAMDKVRELISAAGEARRVEPKTKRKDRYELLGLGEHTAPGATSRLLQFLDGNGGSLGSVVLGRTTQDSFEASKGGTYVRVPGDAQTWLINRPLSASLSLRDWVKTKLIDLPTESITSVRIEQEGEAPYEIVREADGKSHKLKDMPPGKKLKYVGGADNIVEAVSLIEFKSVAKAGKADAVPLKGRAIIETEAGFKPVIEYRSDGEQAWIRIAATGPDGSKALVDELMGRAAGWDFEVPVAEINATLIKLADLLEDAPA